MQYSPCDCTHIIVARAKARLHRPCDSVCGHGGTIIDGTPTHQACYRTRHRAWADENVPETRPVVLALSRGSPRPRWSSRRSPPLSVRPRVLAPLPIAALGRSAGGDPFATIRSHKPERGIRAGSGVSAPNRELKPLDDETKGPRSEPGRMRGRLKRGYKNDPRETNRLSNCHDRFTLCPLVTVPSPFGAGSTCVSKM